MDYAKIWDEYLDVTKDYPIAFTQTCYRTNNGILKQYNDFSAVLENVLDSSCDYVYWPELTLNNQIHFHGFLKIKDKALYHKAIRKLKTQLGYNLFKLIDDQRKWLKYCMKDLIVMSKLLPKKELPARSKVKNTLNSEKKKDKDYSKDLDYVPNDAEKPLEGLTSNKK